MKIVKFQKLKTSFRLMLASLFLGSLVFFVGCSKQDQTAIQPTEDWSGQEIFKAVFFAEGAFAKKIKSYATNIQSNELMNPTQRATFEGNNDALMTAIEESLPNFFESFGKRILSGNHQEIEAAIIDGGDRIFENLEKVYPNINKVYKQVEADVASGEILTDGKIDQQKLEGKISNYQELLHQNMLTPEEEVAGMLDCNIRIDFGCHLSTNPSIVVASATSVVVVIRTKVLHDYRTIGAYNDNLLAFEMLVDELAHISK